MKHLARALRKNMTAAERRLWSHLRDRQLGATRFDVKTHGPLIADFVCATQKLVIELDHRCQHTAKTEADNRCADYLKRNGCKLLRFWNHEVLKKR